MVAGFRAQPPEPPWSSFLGKRQPLLCKLRLAVFANPSGASDADVPHVQKGAALIVNDQKNIANSVRARAFIARAYAFTFAVCAGLTSPAFAADTNSVSTSLSSPHAATALSGDPPADRLGATTDGDATEAPAAAAVDVVPVTIVVDRRSRVVRAVPGTVRDVLAGERIRVRAEDEVSPPLDSLVAAHATVRVSHVKTWTTHVRTHIAARVRTKDDARLALGRTRTIAGGRAGVRETTYRFTRRANGKTTRVAVGSRVVRAPQPRVIARGVGVPSTLARVAEQGFESAVHFAGSALHMIATAYTSACSGCSGITASGVRAGFGVIAVDPRVIPLGTKLFIPGYGRAIAGDTGGAIRGNRIDLGMNTNADAMQFGRRPVTVYVLR